MNQLPKFLRRKQAAEYLNSRWGFGTKSSLAKWAVDGSGPRYRLQGRYPVYTEPDLDIWANSRLGGLQSSTSDKIGAAKRNADLLVDLHQAEVDRSAD